MSESICIREISPYCRCPRCAEEQDHQDALRWYREDWGPGAKYYKPFPRKETDHDRTETE